MCHAVRCKVCGRTTWRGCGLHVAQVRATVPADQWCDGHADQAAGAAGLVSRLFGRR